MDKVGDVWVISPTELSKCENVNKVLFRYVGNGLFCCDDALFENAPLVFWDAGTCRNLKFIPADAVSAQKGSPGFRTK